MGRIAQDLTGKRFTRLLVIKKYGVNQGVIWECCCDCGKTHYAKTGHLNAGAVKSCGCLQVEAGRTTGKSMIGKGKNNWIPVELRQKLKDAYRNMIARCHVPGANRWERYGGRGIGVCDGWRGAGGRQAFYRWSIENGCASDLQLDRINVDGNYEPHNCRWVDATTQQNNTTKNVVIEWQGKSQTAAQWARELGLPASAFLSRYRDNWPMEKIAFVPVGQAR